MENSLVLLGLIVTPCDKNSTIKLRVNALDKKIRIKNTQYRAKTLNSKFMYLIFICLNKHFDFLQEVIKYKKNHVFFKLIFLIFTFKTL